jgi:hypothetical protein
LMTGPPRYKVDVLIGWPWVSVTEPVKSHGCRAVFVVSIYCHDIHIVTC